MQRLKGKVSSANFHEDIFFKDSDYVEMIRKPEKDKEIISVVKVLIDDFLFLLVVS